MSGQLIPRCFTFQVEGEGRFDIWGETYAVALGKLERQLGRNLMGRFYLEKETMQGGDYYGRARR